MGQKFRKRPIIITAEQWFPGKEVNGVYITPEGGAYVFTLEGEMLVSPGDWIITGSKGEIYPCKPDTFEATYVPVIEKE